MARKKTPEINASSTADIAFLLLTFFLMTTTMDVDSGLFRRLPPMPPPDQVIAPPVAKRNILQVLVNKNDLLAVNGELMQIENLKEKAKEFILNPQNREDLPSKVVKEIPFFGQAEVSRGIISLQSDRGTSYKMYIAVQDELTAAYNEIRDIKAMEKWGKKYSELTEEQMDAVRKLVPTAISEAEPKNIGTPAISTASLPDIVFMLLFFFMVSTTMREVLVMVDNGMPEAKEISKLEKKSLVSNIFIGKPKDQYVATYGSEPRIQLNDKLANVNEISSFVAAEQETRKEEERNMITNNLKVDQFTKMGIVTDVKQELRKANSLRISYATRKKVK